MAVCSLPIAVALAATGAETPPARWTAHDALIVLGGGVIDALYNCSIALGLSVTSPVFVARNDFGHAPATPSSRS